jgi:hypothetical protein
MISLKAAFVVGVAGQAEDFGVGIAATLGTALIVRWHTSSLVGVGAFALAVHGLGLGGIMAARQWRAKLNAPKLATAAD